VRIVSLWSAFAAAALISLSAPSVARAADAPAAPAATEEELEAAKEHFAKGKELYDKGDKKGAAGEFKLAYKLSKNAILLYNVALVYDEVGDKSLALHYYEKFLKDAPDNDKTKENKKIATGRVTVLQKELGADDEPEAKPAKPPEPAKPEKKEVTAFTHVTIDEAPPAKPIDIAAQIPESSGWKLSLYYRLQGKDAFTPVPMRPRFQELVGRIPADQVKGQAVQYYIEVKDAQGRLVAQSGSPASPNIVYLDPKAKSHFYWQEGDPVEQEAAPAKVEEKPGVVSEGLDDEDPLGEGKGVRGQIDSDIDLGGSNDGKSHEVGFEQRWWLRGSFWAKWGTSAGAVVLLGTSLGTYLSAKSYGDKLEEDLHRQCNPSPCPWDPYSADLQSTGQTLETISNVTLVAGVVTAGVAGYFWYKDLKRPHMTLTEKPVEQARRNRPRFVAAPLLGDGVVGGAAVIEF
jgi:tetratricopeptide (TPR) repeat protein